MGASKSKGIREAYRIENKNKYNLGHLIKTNKKQTK
jgi:hypothetical protein